MSSIEEKARTIFGARAGFYTTSATHTDPAVLARIVELSGARPEWRALDVGTGTGHTAFALASHVASVIGTDITPEMLGEAERLRIARGVANVSFTLADVHDLPFPDASFDLVVCRRAAHHFSDISRSIAEMRRVLRPGGRLVIDDRSVPEDPEADELMNHLDVLHDRSHVRQYRPSEWSRMLHEAGFEVDAVEPYVQHRPISSLTTDVEEPDRTEIEQLVAMMPERLRTIFDLREVDGVIAFNHWYVIVAAHRIE
jgi:ubiquinone/menaquinone biosynthesis C-methylase UbiE